MISPDILRLAQAHGNRLMHARVFEELACVTMRLEH